MRSGIRDALVAASCAVVLVGCGDSDAGSTETETVSITTTVTATPGSFESEPAEAPSSSEDPYAPNIGDRALTIGDTRVGQAIKTTLKSVRYPYPPDYAREPDAGNDFVGLELEQCYNKDADVDPQYPDTTTYNGDWVVLDPKGYEYGGDGSSWNDWPAPKFPEAVTMNPGRCYKGWISLQAPKGTKIVSVIWRPGGSETAEWHPK
jgi:hypothetical protein